LVFRSLPALWPKQSDASAFGSFLFDSDSYYSNTHAFVMESGREQFHAGDLTVPRAAGGCADEHKIFNLSDKF
jgi:hypothetical protein